MKGEKKTFELNCCCILNVEHFNQNRNERYFWSCIEKSIAILSDFLCHIFFVNGNLDVLYCVECWKFLRSAFEIAKREKKTCRVECFTVKGKKIYFSFTYTHAQIFPSNRLSLFGTSNFMASFFMITYIFVFRMPPTVSPKIVSLCDQKPKPNPRHCIVWWFYCRCKLSFP